MELGRTTGAVCASLRVLTLLMLSAAVTSTDEHDYRFVSHSELQRNMDQFAPAGVTGFSQILFDIQKYQIIVGARDQLYRLSVKGLQELEAVSWPAPESQVTMCENKGQTAEDCHNFVRVLHGRSDRLLACGTFAFQPQCTWRSMDSLRTVYSNHSGVAVCPYSPHFNVTSVLTDQGEIVSAAPTDFSGLDPAVYRRQSANSPMLRTRKYDSRLLSLPDFVGSFETRDFVYFVFREDAVEYHSCGKRVYSRVGRVCKNDRGSRGNVWTTFTKARLNCSVSGEYPFYLDQVQSIHYLDREEVLYATFSTPDNSLVGSAVCAYNLSSINAAFDGAYLRQSAAGGAWERATPPDLTHLHCGSPEVRSGHRLAELAHYTLTAQAVQPDKLDPLYLADGISLVAVATDVITTKHHVSVHVLFVADTQGLIRKLSVVPRSRKTCLVEIMQPFQKNTKILTMKLLDEAGSLYVGTDAGVVRVPVQRCDRYTSEQSCLAAMDPYCGWDSAREVCSPPPGRNPDVSSWRQQVTQCPDLWRPIDGGWSGWSEWQSCRQVAGLQQRQQQGDGCLCRRRACTSPAPLNGGAPCRGPAAEVTNCTRHGGWTSWSAWSACSHPCGVALKSRRRTCTNPSPAHGGRPCVGEQSQEILCHSNPPCPTKSRLPVDGGWGSWSPWGQCSARCGGGHRSRRRHCDSPRPLHGGRPCLGCDQQHEACNSHPCPELRRTTDWTPWLVANTSAPQYPGHVVQQRFRFICGAPVNDVDLIRVGELAVDERHCTADGVCSPANSMGIGWGDWSGWSECSAACGGGVQSRSRVCEGDASACLGPTRVEQECNAHSCKGEWGCWSEWSECSVSCGLGQRTRTRQCRGAEAGAICDGAAISRQPCETPSCTSLAGWEEWSVWSLCDVNGEQHRVRKCQMSDPGPDVCQGHNRETRLCVETEKATVQLASTGPASAEGVSVGVLVGACVGCFLAGALMAAAASFWCLRRRRPPAVRSSKYYDSLAKPAPPNQYVVMRGVPGVHELAEMKSSRHKNSPAKQPVNGGPPPSPLIDFSDNTATIRRSGGNRYSPVGCEPLRVNLDTNTIY